MDVGDRKPMIEEAETMKRIAIYQRGYVSEEEHRTINSFISAIPGARITAVYWDRDGSNRSQFRELISTVRDGGVDAIIAQSLVRFTPNGELCLGVLKELHQRRVRIWFAREQFWNTELTGWLVMSSFAAMNGGGNTGNTLAGEGSVLAI